MILVLKTIQEMGPACRGSKITTKPVLITKHTYLNYNEVTTCASFFISMLESHGLAMQFATGPCSGPSFKMFWTGIL